MLVHITAVSEIVIFTALQVLRLSKKLNALPFTSFFFSFLLLIEMVIKFNKVDVLLFVAY